MFDDFFDDIADDTNITSPEPTIVFFRKIPPREYFLYAIVPCLLIAAGLFPTIAIVFTVTVLPILYLLYRRFGVYLPLSCIMFYGCSSLVWHYDILTVIWFLTLTFAFCGIVFAVQFDAYLASATVAVVFAIFGIMAGAGIVRLVEDKQVESIVYEYVVDNRNDAFIKSLSLDYYSRVTLPSHMQKLDPSDPDYELEATKSFAEYISKDMSVYLWYECVHIGALTAAVAFFIAASINRRSSSRNDSKHDVAELNSSIRSIGGVKKPIAAIADMRLPRAFLWTVALPATVAGTVLSFLGDYGPLSATIMHLFVTMPCAFGCFTLFAFFASLFNGRNRVIAHTLLAAIGVVAVIMPIVLYILSILGVCDCILNLRYWTRFIIED